jgi:hypothetical protein
MQKKLQKRFIVGIIIFLALLAFPSAIKIFQLYIYSPSPEPKPEDFYVRMDDPLFTGVAPAPKEDVEISKTSDGKIFVDAKKDGYTLTLNPDLDVYTSELEKGLVNIDDKTGCNVAVAKSPNENIMTEFNKEKKEYESDPYSEVVRYDIEPLKNTDKEAYMTTEEHEVFGIQNAVWVQGNDGFYSVTQSGMAYPQCKLLMEVLDGFNFRKQ